MTRKVSKHLIASITNERKFKYFMSSWVCVEWNGKLMACWAEVSYKFTFHGIPSSKIICLWIIIGFNVILPERVLFLLLYIQDLLNTLTYYDVYHVVTIDKDCVSFIIFYQLNLKLLFNKFLKHDWVWTQELICQ